MRRRIDNFKNSYLWYSFKKDKIAIICLIILISLVAMAVFAPLIAPYNPYDSANIDVMNSEIPPVWIEGGDPGFILGTDNQGRDLLSTMIYGMRISLLIGIGAVLLQSVMGISIGLISGYFGGRIDSFFMRMADVQLSFSYLMIAIFFTAVLQAAVGVGRFGEIAVPFLILVIGFAQWPQYARTVRASVLAEKNKEYVEAARVAGFGAGRIMWGHIFPNTLSPILVLSTLQVAEAVMSEAALSFLGLGMPISKPSLGSLINSGFEYIFSGSWWITIFPGIILIVLLLSINLLGDFLRDVLNPKLYKG
ncbi:MAG: ABC transporter permease [Denitrovibrio sp.]|nr:MAG: ABC transporter permease [Denitrovibrio sp.]